MGVAAVLAVCVALPGVLWAQGDTEQTQGTSGEAQEGMEGEAQTYSDQEVITRGIGVTVDMVPGDYQHNPVQNNWHIGSIKKDGTGLRWTNKAGASWHLTPDLANQRLLTGTDNPYYAQGQREFKLVISNGQITGFTFAGGTYQRTSPQPQAQAAVQPQVRPQVQAQVLGPVTAAMLPGTYQHNPVQNDWHKGRIEQDSAGQLWWRNNANNATVKWRLTPDLANQRLLTGTDNPYYAQGQRESNQALLEFKLIISNRQFTGFTFAGGTYMRNIPVAIVAPGQPTASTATPGQPAAASIPVAEALKTVNTYTIQQQLNGRYLDAYPDSANDFRGVTRGAQNDESQRWILTPLGNNTFTIQQQLNGRYLDAYPDSANDFRGVTRGAQNDESQRWILTFDDTPTFFDNARASGKDFSMVIMSDPQIYWRCEYCSATGGVDNNEGSAGTKSNQDHAQSITKLIEQVGREKFAGIIINGDITAYGRGPNGPGGPYGLGVIEGLFDSNPLADEFNKFNQIYTTPFETSKINLYPGLGNHDYENNLHEPIGTDCGSDGFSPTVHFDRTRNSCAARSIFFLRNSVNKLKQRGYPISFDYWETNNTANLSNHRNIHGSLAYSWDIGDVHFVQLNNYPAYSFKTTYGYRVGVHAFDLDIRQSLGWLDSDLARAKSKNVILNMHQIQTTERPGCSNPGNKFNPQTPGWDQFMTILDKYANVRAIFAGHIHHWVGKQSATCQFLTTSVGSNTYTIQQKSNGRYMDAHENPANDFRLVTRPAQNDTSQKWMLTPVVGTTNTYTIHQKSNGRYMDAHENAANDFRLVTRPAQGDNTQQWILTPLGNNTYTIQQKSNGRYMDAHENAANDFRLVTRPAQNDNTQQWILTPTGTSTGKQVPVFYSGSAEFNKYLRVDFSRAGIKVQSIDSRAGGTTARDAGEVRFP
ncbi:MAG: RICIN domain-containing protein [Nitrospirota bacterium]|nr:RICIN domain-containing protein [Nitrospirota bacterium]